MKRVAVVLTMVIFLCLGTAMAIEVNDEGYFGIYWDGRLFGYSHYFISQRLSLEGENYYKINSDNIFKVGFGNIDTLEYVSELTVQEGNLLPYFLNILEESKDRSLNIQVIFSKSLIAQKNIFNKEELDYFKEINKQPYLLVKNLWAGFDTFVEHFLILFDLARDLKKREILFYDPITRTIQKIYLSYGRDVDIEISGYLLNVHQLIVYDERNIPCFKIYLRKENQKLVKVVFLSSPVSIELSKKDIVEKVKKSEGLDLFKYKAARADFIIPQADKVNFLKVKFKGKIFGKIDLNHQLPGFSQKFEGTTEQNLTSGTFEVETSNPELKPFDFPISRQYLKDYQSYLLPQPQIESDEDQIKAKARVLTWKAKNSYEAINNILSWIKSEIKIGHAIPSAVLVFEDRFGNSEGLSYLFAALCRASGIPARVIGGLIFSGGNFIPHYWTEAYISSSGWIAVDPALNEVGKLSATHIALWENGDVSDVHIEVENFNPKPLIKIPYFKKELAWAVGEERTYILYKDEKQAGKETVSLKELDMYKDKESYMFTDTLDMEGRLITSKWYLDTLGFPIAYQVSYSGEGFKRDEEYEFEDGLVKRTVIQGSEKTSSKALYSYGAYLGSHEVLGHVALAMGQVPSFKSGETFNIYLFIPEKLELKILEFKVMIPEKVTCGRKVYEAFRFDAQDGSCFWVTREGMMVKLEIPEQGIEYILDSVKLEHFI